MIFFSGEMDCVLCCFDLKTAGNAQLGEFKLDITEAV